MSRVGKTYTKVSEYVWKCRGEADQVFTPFPDEAFIPGWGYPTWSDEFTYVNPSTGVPEIDPTKWNVRDRATFGLLNDASVIYPSQVTVNGSAQAVISAEWLGSPIVTSTGPQGNPTNRWHKTGYFEHRRSTAADVIYSQQYGIWEYRCKLPMVTGESLGTLGAIWLRNASTGELDMTEGWGSGPSGMTAVANLHPAGLKPNTGTTTLTVHTNTSGTGNVKAAWTMSPAVYDEWHTYRLTWLPDLFRFEVDGVPKVSLTPSSTISTTAGTRSAAYLWSDPAFTSPWHIRINLHIGPSVDYWGLPDPAHPEWTADPQQLLVEYVRMYAYTP
jgi:beta-glucanase (GH16 family)